MLHYVSFNFKFLETDFYNLRKFLKNKVAALDIKYNNFRDPKKMRSVFQVE